MTDSDMERLAARFLDGLETPEEREQLDAMIRDDAATGRDLIRMASLDSAIAAVLHGDRIVGRHMPVAEAGLPPASRGHRPRPTAAMRNRWHSPWRWGSLAATLMIMLSGLWAWAAWTATVAERVDGLVAEARGGSYGRADMVHLGIGDTLRPGDAIRTGPDGYVKYAYRDGTTVEIGANASMALVERGRSIAKSVHVEQGVLTAHIAPQPPDAGMVFTTPHATATVVGTILRLTVAADSTAIHVKTGKVEFATASERRIVTAGDSAVAQGGRLSDPSSQAKAVGIIDGYQYGEILYADDFAHGLADWTLFTHKESEAVNRIIAGATTDVRMVSVMHDGVAKPVVMLTGHGPSGLWTGIVISKALEYDGPASLSYDYTYDGKPRLAMDGVYIGTFPTGAFTKPAKPPGEWNHVCWNYVPRVTSTGRKLIEATLFFNGELLGSRVEERTGEAPDRVMLEVVDGTFRFDHVEIRELTKIDAGF